MRFIKYLNGQWKPWQLLTASFGTVKKGKTMKRVLQGLFIVFCLFLATNSLAKEPNEFAEDFFNLIKMDKISEAYDGLFDGSTIPKNKPQAVEMLKRQTSSGLPLYGKILAYENIRKENFGESIIRLVYILKSEIGPTIWEFYFYKPSNNWFLVKITFNDEFHLIEKKE